jgi:hypothetical protein
MVMLIFPVLCINRDTEKILQMENKRVAQLPAVFTEERILKGFCKSFENYLNDNIGFKELAVLANIMITHQIFGLYVEPHILVGMENHLFYVPGDISNPSTLPPYDKVPEKELRYWMEEIVLMRDYYTERNIPFIFVTIPDKEEIYPEYYPISLGEPPYNTRLAQAVQYINEHSDVDAFDLTSDLMRAKNDSESLLYYKSYDPTHWNMNGAFIGYQKIMEHLRVYQNDLYILSEQDFVIEQVPVIKRKGSYSYDEFQDIIYHYIPRNKYFAQLMNVQKQTISGKRGLMEGDAPIQYPNICYYYKNSKCNNGKKLLIFGDSYIWCYILEFFAESFSEFLFCPTLHDKEKMKDAAKAFNPDFVVYEIVERAALFPVK